HSVVQRNRRLGDDRLGHVPLLAQVVRKGHAEAGGVGGRDQLFGIGAFRVLEAGHEGVRRAVEYSAGAVDLAGAALQVAAPGCRCGTLDHCHGALLVSSGEPRPRPGLEADMSGAWPARWRTQAGSFDASSRVNSAAGISLQPLAFCPDHSGEKSPLPCFSACARNGAIAATASGNAGGTALIGPSSRTTRFTMARAGRPVNRLVIAVVRAASLFNAARCTALVRASGHNR